jgi:4-hydroxybutyryl-CoA dehydratase/vinylacetyl-CoA-Delta-isomerase
MYSGQEAMIMLDNVFIPNELIFMDGEYEFASMLVERFTCYHRRSYVCKTGLGDALIGAAAAIADYNGVQNASHIKDKLVEMTHLNETIFAAGIASSYQAHKTPSGNWQNDDMLANVCKHNVTRFPYEIGRLAQDIAGGLMVTMPSEKDFRSPEVGPLLEKYLKGRKGVSTENRMRILRLIENMTLGRNAVGYLTESMHGAGSPQAQRIQIARQMQLETKKKIAKRLAKVKEGEAAESVPESTEYFDRIFGANNKKKSK